MTTPTAVPKNLIPKTAYHCSNPIFRDKIALMGLIPKPPSDGWMEYNVSTISPKGEPALFASLTSQQENMFKHLYDDDIYQIDLSQLDNTWFFDPYITQDSPTSTDEIIAFTRQPIPATALTLIYQGTGEPTE